MKNVLDDTSNDCLEKTIRARLYPLQYKATPYAQKENDNGCRIDCSSERRREDVEEKVSNL